MENDDKLTLAAQKAMLGDETAFLEICRFLKLKLYRTAIGILGNESLALDAIDETVYKAFKGIKKLKSPQYVTTWFVRILINTCHDIYRKRQREVVMPDVPQEAPNDTSFDRLQIEELLNTLPEDLRQIISMKYFSGLTLAEIAEVLQTPVGTVKSKLNRALKFLRLEIEK